MTPQSLAAPVTDGPPPLPREGAWKHLPIAPRSLGEAFSALGNGKQSLLLAGGTDIIVQLREGRRRCDRSIDLKHIPELTSFRFTADGGLEIGAATPLAELYENADVRKRFQPSSMPRPSSVVPPSSRGRALAATSATRAAADSSPAMIALGAHLVIAGRTATGKSPSRTFSPGPGRNTLQPGEIYLGEAAGPGPELRGVLPPLHPPEQEMDIAVASSGVSITLDGAGNITAARVALGAVAATP
ncbi:MAG: FAD binding domain-containing protein [Dehalococcoidia bacterium]